MSSKKVIIGGINRKLSREQGFTPEDLAKDNYKAIKPASAASATGAPPLSGTATMSTQGGTDEQSI